MKVCAVSQLTSLKYYPLVKLCAVSQLTSLKYYPFGEGIRRKPVDESKILSLCCEGVRRKPVNWECWAHGAGWTDQQAEGGSWTPGPRLHRRSQAAPQGGQAQPHLSQPGTPLNKCRLYWCLIRVSRLEKKEIQSVMVAFSIPLVNYSVPLTFSLDNLHLSTPPLHVWISTGVCIYTVCKRGREDRVVWRASTGVILCVFDQIRNLKKLLYHPKQKPRREHHTIYSTRSLGAER